VDEACCWGALGELPYLGTGRVLRLVELLGGVVAAWRAGPDGWTEAMEFTPGVAARLLRAYRPDRPALLARACRTAGITVVPWPDPAYPFLLRAVQEARAAGSLPRTTPGPPVALYVRGSLEPGEPAVAVVGSRQATDYGVSVARELGAHLAAAGVTVLSGLARGIDTAGHQGTLAAGGRTVAVLAGGLDQPWQEAVPGLARAVARSGALVTEYPPGTPAARFRFAERNRIIAGAAAAVVVVEAARRSGALITAAVCRDLGRPVFAVPGSVRSPTSVGCHALIRDGAELATTAADVLAHYDVQRLVQLGPVPRPAHSPGRRPAPRPPAGSDAGQGLGPEEARLLEALDSEPVSLEQLVRRAGGQPRAVLLALTGLELKGLVHQWAGNRYSRAAGRPGG